MQIYNATEIQNKKITALIYAPPGMGKTSAAKYFPGKTLVLDIDRTSDVLRGNKDIDICKIENIGKKKDAHGKLIDGTGTYEQWSNVLVELSKKTIMTTSLWTIYPSWRGASSPISEVRAKIKASLHRLITNTCNSNWSTLSGT